MWNLTQVLHDNPQDPGDITAGGLANPSRLREAAGSQRSATGTSGALGGGPRGKKKRLFENGATYEVLDIRFVFIMLVALWKYILSFLQ